VEINPYESPVDTGNPVAATTVSRLPDKVSFACESCGWRPWAWQIRRHLGACRKCQAKSWSITASYTDVDTPRVSPLSVLALSGLGWIYLYSSLKRLTNHVTVTNVGAEVILELVDTDRLIRRRVSEYLRIRERQKLEERGAIVCPACEVLFVPAANKPWNQQGYCSKACAADHATVCFTPVADEQSADRHRVTVLVVCPSGHESEHLASFSGCFRPCPVCGTKCKVP
jgi:hypothetical protein